MKTAVQDHRLASAPQAKLPDRWCAAILPDHKCGMPAASASMAPLI